VLVRIKNWERYGLKFWIEAAKRRLHHDVLAIALANKLARIAWAVLARTRLRADEDRPCRRRPTRLILAPYSARSRRSLATPEPAASQARRGLDRPCARRDRRSAGRDEGTALGSNKGTARYEEQAMT
jgi:hypothetical protein